MKKIIGEGSYKRVFLEEESGIEVAAMYPKRKNCRAQVIREGEILAQFEHRNIPQLRNISKGKHVRISTEYIPGVTWKKRLEQTAAHQNYQTRMHHSLHIMREVSQALVHAQEKGYVHLDLNPNNVLVVFEEGKLVRASVIDWAGSRKLKGETEEGYFFTPEFSAPEIIYSDCTDTSDVYSLGVNFLYAIEGNAIFGDLKFDMKNKAKYPFQMGKRIPQEADRLARKVDEEQDGLGSIVNKIGRLSINMVPGNRVDIEEFHNGINDCIRQFL
ncbi:MAG: protein kinase [Nanoarchaeota archaeon]|nr:protein kinase [Nanoarchaeota archaeon]